MVKPSWQVKKIIVAHIPGATGLDPHEWHVRLARSDQRYAVVSYKNSSSGHAFLRRPPGARWVLLKPLSWAGSREDLCTVAKLKTVSVPKSVRRDFVAARICFK